MGQGEVQDLSGQQIESEIAVGLVRGWGVREGSTEISFCVCLSGLSSGGRKTPR